MKTDDPTDELPMRGASCDWISQRFYSLFYVLKNVELHLCASRLSTFCWSVKRKNITTSINSRGSHAIAAQWGIQPIPPSSGSIVETVCRFFFSDAHQCELGILLLVVADISHSWTHHTIHLARMRFWDLCEKKKIPPLISRQLACHPKSWSRRSRRVSLLVKLLLVLKTF